MRECVRDFLCVFGVICDGIPSSVSKNPRAEEEVEVMVVVVEARGPVHELSLRNAPGCRWRFQTDAYFGL